MSLLGNYAVWNNKGGVGKSTITFHLASLFALHNPTKKVVVLDLCPQSNSSMMLLGGGEKGEKATLDLCQLLPVPKTVVGYLGQVITAGAGAALPDPFDFLLKVKEYNQSMPANVYLLCGDGNLEPMAPAISEQASARAFLAVVEGPQPPVLLADPHAGLVRLQHAAGEQAGAASL